MPEKPDIEVLPPAPIGLDQLAAAAAPLVKQLTDAQIAQAKEETARLQIKVDAEKEIALKRIELRRLNIDNLKQQTSFANWQDFLIIIAALATFGSAMVYGMITGKDTYITHALLALGTFLGGFGTGRATQGKPGKPPQGEAHSSD